MKNFNIMGVYWKILFLGGNFLKGGGGLGQFSDLRWGLLKKRGVVFLRGEVIPQYTLWYNKNFLSMLPKAHAHYFTVLIYLASWRLVGLGSFSHITSTNLSWCSQSNKSLMYVYYRVQLIFLKCCHEYLSFCNFILGE